MAKSSLKWPIAKGPNGDYVHIQDATRGGHYRCPQCSGRFVVRQGSMKAWHFAHHAGAICTGEGARHDITKHMIAAALGRIERLPLYCGCSLLPTDTFRVEFTDILVEETVGDHRIDVTCNVKGRELRLEVVDSNPVGDEKRQALQDSLVEINISRLSDDEVFRGDETQRLLEKGLSFALERLVRKHVFIHVWSGTCWKCGKQRRVATVCGLMWPDSLPSDVLAALRKHTKMEFRRTSEVREGYWANVCPHCNTIQGDWCLQEEMMEILNANGNQAVQTVFVPTQDERWLNRTRGIPGAPAGQRPEF